MPLENATNIERLLYSTMSYLEPPKAFRKSLKSPMTPGILGELVSLRELISNYHKTANTK